MTFSLDRHYEKYSLTGKDWSKIFFTLGSGWPYAARHFELSDLPSESAWRHRMVGLLQCCPLVGLPFCGVEYLAQCFGYLTVQRPLPPIQKPRACNRLDKAPLIALLKSRKEKLTNSLLLNPVFNTNENLEPARYASTGAAFIKKLAEYSQPYSWAETSYSGYSALHLAVDFQREEFVDAILCSGFKMRLLNQGSGVGDTPIALAVYISVLPGDLVAYYRKYRIIEKLLACNPALNRTNSVGRSPLQNAAIFEDFAVCKRLLWLGGTLAINRSGNPKKLNERAVNILAIAHAELKEDVRTAVESLKLVATDLNAIVLNYLL
jgi:hypothetical protein